MIKTKTNREYLVFRLAVIAWLIGWFFKYAFFAPHLLFQIHEYPVIIQQFPAFFQNKYVAGYAYFLPLLAIIGIFFQRRRVYLTIGLVLLSCATLLGLHIDTYNDMTFISSFWVAIWLVWYAYYIDDTDHIKQQAPMLAKCIIGLLFLGGTIGKLTPEYWSGEVFYNTVIRQTPGFFGSLVVQYCSVEQQKFIMSLVSKIIIIAEGLLVLSPVYPYRLFATFSALTILMLVFFRHWQILSVLSCLGGMVLACLLLIHQRQKSHA